MRARSNTQKPPTLPKLLPFKRAAAEVGIPYCTLRDCHFRGELEVVKIGRSWYVSIEQLTRFVERQTVKGGR